MTETPDEYAPIITIDPVHDYLRNHPLVVADDGMLIRDVVGEILPDNAEDVVLSHSESTHVKVPMSVSETISGMAGNRVRKGEVLAYYVLLDMVERGEDIPAGVLLEAADLLVADAMADDAEGEP